MPSAQVNLVNGAAEISQNPDPLTLNYNAAIAVTVGTGFPAGCQISAVEFHAAVSGGGGASKGAYLGTWTRANSGTQPITEITVSASGNNVQLRDTDNDTTDKSYFYGLTVQNSNGTQSWSADPEIIAKKNTGTADAAGA
jgi:hypothetical protein